MEAIKGAEVEEEFPKLGGSLQGTVMESQAGERGRWTFLCLLHPSLVVRTSSTNPLSTQAENHK